MANHLGTVHHEIHFTVQEGLDAIRDVIYHIETYDVTTHPEAYPVVERILAATQQALKDLMGNSSELRNLKASDFTDEKFGVPTVTDIIKELEKPGRDPRPEFNKGQPGTYWRKCPEGSFCSP